MSGAVPPRWLAGLAPIALCGALLAGACFNDEAGRADPSAVAGAAQAQSASQPSAQSAGPEGDSRGRGTAAGLAAEAGGQATSAPAVAPAGAPAVAPAIPDHGVTIFVEPAPVRPGGVFLVAIDTTNASAAWLTLDGRPVPLAREGDRFYAILPVPFGQPAGGLIIEVEVAGPAGNLALRQLIELAVLAADFPIEHVQLDPALSRLLDPAVVAEDRALRDAVQRAHSPLRLWDAPFRAPADGVITSTFGVRRAYNGAPASDYHSGLDFGAPRGTEVVAANAGVVAWTGETERRGRGVIIDHGQGVFSSYWHLASVATTPGSVVTGGAPIGRVGNTGLSTGSHLHWELTVGGVPVDPAPWLRDREVPDPLAHFDPGRAVNAPRPASP